MCVIIYDSQGTFYCRMSALTGRVSSTKVGHQQMWGTAVFNGTYMYTLFSWFATTLSLNSHFYLCDIIIVTTLKSQRDAGCCVFRESEKI